MMRWRNKDQRVTDGRRPFWRDRCGSSAVEFALVAPVFGYMMLTATDFGMSIYQRAQISNAARAGAQYASMHGWNSSAVSSAATSATKLTVTATPSTYCGCSSSGAIVQQACNTTCTGGGTLGSYVSVTTTGNYTPISPFYWGKSQTSLSATAVARTN